MKSPFARMKLHCTDEDRLAALTTINVARVRLVTKQRLPLNFYQPIATLLQLLTIATFQQQPATRQYTIRQTFVLLKHPTVYSSVSLQSSWITPAPRTVSARRRANDLSLSIWDNNSATGIT
jgi:hypothetical protein